MSGAELHELRRAAGLTQCELAARVGVAGNTVARWERGERGIPEPAARLVRLATGQRVPRELRRRER